jgi:long-subunit fatty acid transport protein
MRRQHVWLVIVLLLGLTLPARGEAGGLSNTETFGGFEFNFNNPGARALGMGGAFIGLADDATAAVANPAGLVILQRPELSAEVKFTRFRNEIKAYSNNIFEAPTATVHSRTFDDSVTTPSFFSFVFPTERLVTAVFVRELSNFQSNFQTQGTFFPNPAAAFPGLPPGTSRLFPVQSKMEFTAVDVGAGVGVNLSKQHRLLPDIGASLEFSYGVVHSRLDRFGFNSSTALISGPANYSPTNINSTNLVDGSDIGVGFNFGALWRPLKELSVGVVYRRGPRYNMRETLEFGPAGLQNIGTPTAPVFVFGPRTVADFSLKVPDVYGLGAAVRPLDRLTFSVDVVRIRYSQMIEGFNVLIPTSVGALQAADFKLKDATEFHVGAEYIMFLGTIPIAARAGFYTNPDHRIRYTGPVITNRLFFPGGQDQYHATAGVGIVPLPGVQFDAAANVSREIREFSLSTVFRF